MGGRRVCRAITDIPERDVSRGAPFSPIEKPLLGGRLYPSVAVRGQQGEIPRLGRVIFRMAHVR
jgi:hypothetical protein